MKKYFCWRCNEVMPFLDEKEWEIISPLLTEYINQVKIYRKENKCDLNTARTNVENMISNIFEDLTGVSNIHYEIIYHHRLSEWGPECKNCGHLFRTNNAKFCTNCGNKE